MGKVWEEALAGWEGTSQSQKQVFGSSVTDAPQPLFMYSFVCVLKDSNVPLYSENTHPHIRTHTRADTATE